ncbi:hypothetical protein KSP40_PGU018236 [Platanthera guangdongensis]|uniref:Uncharacterized protein n=1 Tax=Platanthera guangdongensis TaxID=2320717 RepID=A0ABR2MUZ3_9ASPA
MTRYVIPTDYFCSPEFRQLLKSMEEEFGYNQEGGLRIPCEVEDFEEMLRVVGGSARKVRKKHRKA